MFSVVRRCCNSQMIYEQTLQYQTNSHEKKTYEKFPKAITVCILFDIIQN